MCMYICIIYHNYMQISPLLSSPCMMVYINFPRATATTCVIHMAIRMTKQTELDTQTRRVA